MHSQPINTSPLLGFRAKLLLLGFLFSCIIGSVSAQDNLFSHELRFADYLIENKEYKDAIAVLSAIPADSVASETQQDSLNYYLGWSYFNKKAVDTSFVFFEKVRPSSSFYYKSLFHASFGEIYREKRSEARSLLSTLPPDADSSML